MIVRTMKAVFCFPKGVIRFHYALMLLATLVVADGLITKRLIDTGIASESNPFLRVALLTGDFMPIKILGSLLVIIILADLNRHNPRWAVVTVWSSIVLYTGIVYWNIGVFLSSFH